MTTGEKNNKISNWINRNAVLLSNYKDQWIAYNINGLVAHDKELAIVKKMAEKKGEEYIYIMCLIFLAAYILHL